MCIWSSCGLSNSIYIKAQEKTVASSCGALGVANSRETARLAVCNMRPMADSAKLAKKKCEDAIHESYDNELCIQPC